LGAILASWGHPGRPWEQQEGHVGIQGRIFSDFGMILGPHFESFSGTEGKKSGVVFEFVSMSLLTPYGRYCKNQLSAEVVVFMISGSNFNVF